MGRKRFSPGQKHALNNKFREAERKRRPFPNFDSWMDNYNLDALSTNMRPNAYKGKFDTAMNNFRVNQDNAWMEDELNDEEGYNLPEEEQGDGRSAFNLAYGQPGSDGGEYGSPETTLSDYETDEPEENMGSALGERDRELVHKVKSRFHYANARSVADNPLLVRYANRENKKGKIAEAKGKQSEKNATHLERRFRKEHAKPAFDMGGNTGWPKSDTIGEITVPKGHQEAYDDAKDYYKRHKKEFNY